MTHDELVRFAAEKVGGVVDEDIDGSISIKMVDEINVENERKLKVNNFYDLASPDLFFRGLAAAVKEGMEPFFECDRVGFLDTHDQYGGVLLDKKVESVSEIPQKFWECWAEVEGIGNLTKDGA